ncbi:MAG: RNA polymerase sigma factor [Saprospiraceae bacterium]|nr:RNA polymerase sigma factor [Saprospiraceae bacterium]MDW8484675.1 RNA polymerase sigma factor [Saprospiraceae bacterium]
MTILEFNCRLNDLTNMLQTFAYNLTKNSEEAKDLYQETAYRALANRDKFRPGTNFKAWMFTIMKNIFINNYRRKVKANTIIDTTDNQFYLNSGSHAVGNSAESEITLKELSELVSALDDNTRIPFLMHFEGYKYQEIADHLGLPLGTVKSRIFFARKELKEKILSNYGFSLGKFGKDKEEDMEESAVVSSFE